MPNAFLEIYFDVEGLDFEVGVFVIQSYQRHSPNTQNFHSTAILLQHRVTKLQAHDKKVFTMKDYDKSETHDSPVTDLAAPLLFIAGLFALVAMLSFLG